MRLLDRYLFRELLTPLAYCVAGIQSFIIFSTAFNDAGKIRDAKLHFFETLEYSAAASMESLTLVLPVALLLALLYALTHHARHNEITAMRAAGISLWRICVPYLVVGLIASGAVFALNELIVPRSADFAARLLNHNEEPVPTPGAPNPEDFANVREHRLWTVNDYRAGTGDMYGVQVEWITPDGADHSLMADHAVRTNGVWTFFDVSRELYKSNTAAQWVPMIHSNDVAMPEFDETTREFSAEIKINKFLNTAGLHHMNVSLSDTLTFFQWHPNLSRSDRGRLLTQLQDRIASPFTCLVVALIAIPFGAAPGRRNLFFGVAGSITICFIFFILQRISLAMGSSGVWPVWLAAWMPNLVFGLLGLILTARIR